ncbi:MAG: hypothetical protein R2781_01685 [Flavobacteriaceae bacterium]
MDTNTYNIYLFKALDAYPFNLEETIESLNYALSYHPKDAEALLLMAKVYAYQIKDYETAKHYFEEVMIQKMEMPKLYPEYIFVLINNEDYTEAQRLLEYALKIKATDKAVLQLLQGQLFEAKQELKNSLDAFKKAKRLGRNCNFIEFTEKEISRVKSKLPKNKKKKSHKSKRKEKKTSLSKK